MELPNKQLGQLRPANTDPASLYSPPADTLALLSLLIVCNVSAAEAKFRVFLDDDGTTYDQSTAIYYDRALAANRTEILALQLGMSDEAGNLAVRSDVASALTFTLYGEEF